MDSRDCILTVITPTIGRPGLERLIASIEVQNLDGGICHILLWDDHRAAGARPPEEYSARHRLSLVLGNGFGRNGDAPGSPLRAVGLVAAATPWVTLADDDVVWDHDHAASLLAAAGGRNWASCLRRIVTPEGELLGLDEFQSIGDAPGRRVPWEMCDGNTMVFRRRFGVVAAPLFRETKEYNDDRRLYALLKARAGPRGSSGRGTIQQVCPPSLVTFFRENCTPLRNTRA